MTNNKYLISSLGLYMNYFCHGIQSIIISQNINTLAALWGTDTAGVMSVIAFTGIGKVVVLCFSGPLSDRVGRRPLIVLGSIGYICFFGGLLLSTSVAMAKLIAFTAGAATSLFDGAVNPALFEIYPKNKSIASLTMKGFIATSGVIWPLLIGFLDNNGYWFGISIMIPLIIMAVNLVFLFFAKLPDSDLQKETGLSAREAIKKLEVQQAQETAAGHKFNKQPKLQLEGGLLMLYAFFCMATFYLFQQVIKLYGSEILGMSAIASGALMSYYTIGSFLAVLLTSIILSRGIRDMTILIAYPLISALAAFSIYFFPSEVLLRVCSFIIGFTAAGGTLQVGAALLSTLFPTGKGRNTSLYYVSMSVAAYVIPVVASSMMKADFTKIMLLDGFMGLGGFVVMLLLGFRYKGIFNESPFSLKKKSIDIKAK